MASKGRRTILVWALTSGVLTIGMLLSAILATVLLDALVQRPALGGSMTTILPGFVYASATVMKVCVAAGLTLGTRALTGRVWTDDNAPELDAAHVRKPGLPLWGILSLALAPVAPLAGAVAVLLAQASAATLAGLSREDFSHVSRTGVFTMLSVITVGGLAAGVSLVRRERPGLVPLFGLIVNGLLIWLFWRNEFYALGFDQDTWAPR